MRTKIGRWRRLHRRGGRLAGLGHDYDQGHLTYFAQSGKAGRLWLRTKPFSVPPTPELARCLHSFVHIVDRLRLGPKAKILDVGCGPGWLSELLARCGYVVTGIDLAPDMIEIARERASQMRGPIGEDVEPEIEFLVVPVLELPWYEHFDAALLYDTMHHFEHELETLLAVRRTLLPGGRLYLHEGRRPEPGSPQERALISEMERFGTLEAPFEPDYLAAVLEQAGFTDIKRFVEIDALVPAAKGGSALEGLTKKLEQPDTNTFLALNPIATAADAHGVFSAQFTPLDGWERSPDGTELWARVAALNTGEELWPAGLDYPFPRGSVTVAPYLPQPDAGRVELPRAILPRSLRPGESAVFQIAVPTELARGASQVGVDLIREGVAWFSDRGSEPLLLSLATG
jgi:SAM-dependent methyltransferase